MKHIVAILLLVLLASCSSLTYLPNDLDNIPKTMKAQSAIMQQVLDNYYIMGIMDYRSSIESKAPLLIEGADYYYMESIKKSNKDMYKLMKKYIKE